MTTIGVPETQVEPRRPRLNRRVLVGNVVSGVLLLLLTLPLTWSIPLFLIASGYVAAGSVFLAAVYAREGLAWGQEALAWIAPWLVAVMLWTWVGSRIEGGDSAAPWLLLLWFGLALGTPCYLAWQFVALAMRQLMARESRTAAGDR